MEQVNNEKVTNKFYVAVYILLFVFASLMLASAVIIIIALAEGSVLLDYYNDLISQGYYEEYALTGYYVAQNLLIVYAVISCIGATVMYVEGAYFKKYSSLTNSEAEQYYGRCLGWVITSYFFGGLLVGGLATAGLCVTQNKQRRQTNVAWATSDGKVVDIQQTTIKQEEDKYSPENLEKMKLRLQKLKTLKESGAISEEEYNALREKVLGKTKEQPKPEIVDDNPNELNIGKLERMTQRLGKIKELKEAGALTEEEYNKLRDKIINGEDK